MKNQKTVLVTGSSGFIGSHIVIQLLEKGYAVRGTVRSLDRTDSMKQMISYKAKIDDLSFVECDLTSDNGWDDAMQGIDYVLHIASPIPRTSPKDPNDLIIPATEGALRAVKAAEKAGVERFVMTASTACIVYGYGNTGKTFTEADWSDPDGNDNTSYTRSKTIAEKTVREYIASRESQMSFCTIHPGAVLGPVLEKDYGTSAEIVLKLLKGDFPGIPKMGFPLVDVRDVADLHIKAMEAENVDGERFLCANDFMWIGEIADVLRQSHPQFANKLPTMKLANWMVKLAALFDPVTASVLNELGIRRDCDSSKSKNILNWNPRSNEEAIKATADSLIKQGLV